MPSANANRRFNSIARRIQRSWQWKKLWQIIFLNLLAVLTALAAYLYTRETAVTGTFAGWDSPRSLTMDESLSSCSGSAGRCWPSRAQCGSWAFSAARRTRGGF